MRGATVDPNQIDVYIAQPVRCPYLPDREEQKLLVPLDSGGAAVYDALIALGFRRSGRWAYRPRCVGCVACVPVRIEIAAFVPSRSQRRAARASASLVAALHDGAVDDDAYQLFTRYLDARHADGNMAAMGERDFEEMMRADIVHSEFWRWRDGSGELQAAMLVDVVADGISLVYSFFAPERANRSPGVAIVLAAVAEAQRRGLPYVYLGYWVDGCAKMTYKAAFAGLEAFSGARWRAVHLPDPRRTLNPADDNRSGPDG